MKFTDLFQCSFEETEESRKQEGQFDLPKPEHLKESLYYYISDYTREAYHTKIRNMLDVHADFARKIIEEADLSDVRYLYYFGEYISEKRIKDGGLLKYSSGRDDCEDGRYLYRRLPDRL